MAEKFKQPIRADKEPRPTNKKNSFGREAIRLLPQPVKYAVLVAKAGSNTSQEEMEFTIGREKCGIGVSSKRASEQTKSPSWFLALLP